MGRLQVRRAFENAISNAGLPYVGTVFAARPEILQEDAYTQTMNGQAIEESVNGSACVIVVNIESDDRTRYGLVGRNAVADWNKHIMALELFFCSMGGKGIPAQEDYDTVVDALVTFIRQNPTMSAPATVWSAGEYCYDDQTEILTDQGWKLFKNLDQTERVASRTDDGIFVWERPSAYVANDWTAEMVEFKSQSVDLLVTPNHRILVGTKHSGAAVSNEVVLRADEAMALSRRTRRELAIPTVSTWHGLRRGEKVLAGVGRSRSYRVPMRAWAEFLGLYMAEGSTRVGPSGRRQTMHHDVIVSQSQSSARLGEVRRILAGTPFSWAERCHANGMVDFIVSSSALANELVPLGYSWQKSVPYEIKNADAETIAAFIHGFWVGDGFIKNKERSNSAVRGFATSSRVLADDLQEMLQKCGVDAYVAIKDQSRWKGQFAKRLAYQVVERASKSQQLPKGRLAWYNGKVFCVSVPSGVLYVRRNGRAVWCGNTYGVKHVQDAAYTSEDGLSILINGVIRCEAWEQEVGSFS